MSFLTLIVSSSVAYASMDFEVVGEITRIARLPAVVVSVTGHGYAGSMGQTDGASVRDMD
jgi:hypothetical protein